MTLEAFNLEQVDFETDEKHQSEGVKQAVLYTSLAIAHTFFLSMILRTNALL
jgi:hypothetical protein